MKVIYSGIESSGKSLKLAKVASDLAYRNAKWFKQSGKRRTIYSNMQFAPVFFHHVTVELGVPIKYWKDLDELVEIVEADVLIDEVGNYFDARNWSNVTLDQRRWLTQGAKSGIEIYGAAQDFAQVDLSFRRLVNELYLIQKMIGSPRPAATKPPVNRIWGMCAVWSLNPQNYKEDSKEFDSNAMLPSFMFIRRQDCEIFDTQQKIARSAPPFYKHLERFCSNSACGYKHVTHS